MNKIEIYFLPPLSLFIINLKKYEISIEEPISLKVLEQKLINTFPDIKKSVYDLNEIIYMVDDRRVFDKNIYVEKGSKVRLMAPLSGG